MLADASLSLEANTVCRTLLELAVQSCWVRTDEARAWRVWNKFVRDQHRGLTRFGTFTNMMAPPSDEQRRSLNKIPVPPGLDRCAEEAEDTTEFAAKKLARALYHLHYDELSTGAHGDLRDAITLVQWNRERKLLARGLEIARFAAVTLLCASALQLGFRDELERHLTTHEIPTAFSSLAT